jgi:hypothetical protein
MASSKLTKSSSSIKKKASSSTTKPYKGISGTSDLVYRGSGNEKPVNAVYRRGKTKGLDQTMKEGLEAWNKKEREYFNKQKTGNASTSSTAVGNLTKKASSSKKMMKTATPRKTTTAPNKTGNTKKYIY